MTGVNMRKIVKIYEETFNGCGICIPSCAEGALKIIDGKARLVSEKYCDGLGACLAECPEGAIAIEERPADKFDEAAVKEYLEVAQAATEELPCGCASSTVRQINRDDGAEPAGESGQAQPSLLGHWPVQLTLVPPGAPFLNGSDLLLVADCVPFAYGNFHRDFLRGHSVIVACPKLDDFDAHQAKLNAVLKGSDIKSLTVLHMEVPCCSGLIHLARQALLAAEKSLPLRDITIGMHGDILK